MSIFAISDLHLSFSVKKPMDIFGDGWQNHFAKIAEAWESAVTPNDVVLLGGDISWGLTMEEAQADYDAVASLPGKKYVLRGNHDYYWNSLSKMRARFPDFTFIQNNAFRETDCAGNCGAVIAGSRLWSVSGEDSAEEDIKIYKRELQRLELSLESAAKLRQTGDKLIAVLHYPPFEANYADTEVTALLEKYRADIVLYGHLHGKNVRVKEKLTKNGIDYFLTSCDLIGYKPVKVL